MSIVAHDRTNGQSHGALPLHLLPTPPAVSDTREDAGVDEQEAALPAPAATKPKDRLADGLTAVVAGSAAFSSWTGWVLLGHAAAWPKQGLPFGLSFDTAWLNPISVDVLAYLGMRAWVSPTSSKLAKAWGRGAALGALGLSILGNAVGHALESNPTLLPNRLPLVVVLAAIAPIILVVVLHLRTLRNTPPEVGGGDPPPEDALPADPPAVETPSRQVGGTLPAAPAGQQVEPPPVVDQVQDTTQEEEEPSPEPEVEPTQETPEVADGKQEDAEVIEAIRNLDAKYGRRTGVDRIKADLSIGTSRASRLRKAADTKATS